MGSRAQIDLALTEIRRRWHAAHAERFAVDPDSGGDESSWRDQRLTPHAGEARELIDTLRRTGDLRGFQEDSGRWVRTFDSGYSGTAGQMIINQIAKMSPDHEEAAAILVDALTVPADLDDAVRKIRLLADHLQEIRIGAHPSPRRAPFVASYHWGLAAPETWPVAWPKSIDYWSASTGAHDADDQGEHYRDFHRFVVEVDGDVPHFERVAAWWADTSPVVLDDSICDRARLAEGAKERGDAPDDYRDNARGLVAIAQHLGRALESAVADAAGRALKAQKPALMWSSDWPRGDLWVDWRVPKTYGLAVRVWFNARGMAIGLRPYPDGDAGATERAMEVIDRHALAEHRVLAGGASKVGADVGFVGGGTGEILYGRWFGREDFTAVDLTAEIVGAARAVGPLVDDLVGETPATATDDAEMAGLVAEFKAALDYPTPGHELSRADRREFAKLLSPDGLRSADRTELRRIWNSGRYGGNGPQSVLNTTFRDADDAEYQRILATFDHLCWGDGPVAERIDRVLDDDHFRIKGFSDSVIMKLLAITQPDHFITAYPYVGDKGKRRMLQVLGLPIPEGSRGTEQVTSNDALRARMERHFPDDPLGIGEFLYWLVEREEAPVAEPTADPLDDLADELLVDRDFIDEVIALLEDKKQVVFYGPPGTGKTYFAQKLAEALVPDAERRPIVQFHPSTSYEDFVEGYRPDTDDHGAMTYRLRKGPLAELAERAQEAPGRRHLMIIDEINRANLPKVLGEMLFLFEYRNTPVRTLYRTDEPFELSGDVWFIGTMNTADRSIALIDAALRRRFHFVPFFPNSGSMAGLLDRWLAREGEPAWVGELVQQVNQELSIELGGPHLQLGASHFMKHHLDEAALRRIWTYDIEPFIEDQFFGDADRIDQFRFPQVLERFRALAPESFESAATAESAEFSATPEP